MLKIRFFYLPNSAKNKAIKIASFLFIIFFALGNILRFELRFLPVPGINVLGLDALLFFFNIVGIICLWRKKKKFKVPISLKYGLLFLGMISLSFITHIWGKPIGQILAAGAYLARLINYFMLAFFISLMREKKILRVSWIFGKIILAVVGLSFLGTLQYLIIPDLRPLYILGWDDHYYRLVSPLLDPNFSGLIFIIGLILLNCSYEKKIWQTKKISLYQLILFGLFITLVLTLSRGSWFVAAVVMFIYMWQRDKAKEFVAICLMGLLVFWLMPKPYGEGVNIFRTSTLRARLTNYQEAAQMINKNFLFGVGYNFLRFEKANWHLLSSKDFSSHAGAGFDNSFLFTWVTGGIFTLLALIYFFIKIILYSLAAKQRLILFLITLAIIIHSFFYNSFYYPFVMVLFFMVLAVS